MKIGPYTFEEYIDVARTFHGFQSPGMILGGIMVDLAINSITNEELYDAICETPHCLPDAVQLLTPCTIGNGWLRIIDFGRFALTLYRKMSGEGIRVFLDAANMGPWPEIKVWFLRTKSKKEQNTKILLEEIRDAGTQLCKCRFVKVKIDIFQKREDHILICPICREAYRSEGSNVCPFCQTKDHPYYYDKNTPFFMESTIEKFGDNPQALRKSGLNLY